MNMIRHDMRVMHTHDYAFLGNGKKNASKRVFVERESRVEPTELAFPTTHVKCFVYSFYARIFKT